MKKTLWILCLLLLGLVLPASALSSAIYDTFRTMDYGDYQESTEYVLSNDKIEGVIQKASVIYGENYVEYLVEGEHTTSLFLTEEGALYSFDGEILNVTKPNEKNSIFAHYMETLSTLLQEHYEEFRLVSTATFEGCGSLEGKALNWSMKITEEPDFSFVSYNYLFEDGTQYTLQGRVLTKELKEAKTLIDLIKLPSFEETTAK